MAETPRPPLDAPLEGSTPPRRAAVQPTAWARARLRWSAQAQGPWLHGEVARRLAGRLTWLREPPQRMALWDDDGGASLPALRAACPDARVLRVVPGLQPTAGIPPEEAESIWSPVAPQPSAGGSAWWRRLGRLMGSRGNSRAASGAKPEAPEASPMPRRIPAPALAQAPADLVWSNLDLHTHPEPDRLLKTWHDALRVEGLLLFSTFGPDTLRELAALWAQRGWGPACQPFIDMHDWGDALVRAGFGDPVMDQETVRLSWADPQAALAELRGLATNAHPKRFAGCRGRSWRAEMLQSLEGLRGPDGRITLSFEIVYGHAVRPPPRAALAPETTISLQEMRALVQTTRRRE